MANKLDNLKKLLIDNFPKNLHPELGQNTFV